MTSNTLLRIVTYCALPGCIYPRVLVLFLVFFYDLPGAIGPNSAVHGYVDDTSFTSNLYMFVVPLVIEKTLQKDI